MNAGEFKCKTPKLPQPDDIDELKLNKILE